MQQLPLDSSRLRRLYWGLKSRYANKNVHLYRITIRHTCRQKNYHAFSPLQNRIFIPLTMVKLPKIPETSEDFNDVVSYLESGTFPTKYNTSTKRTNFQRRCKNFAYDRQKGYLF